jgi:hypothetical protein
MKKILFTFSALFLSCSVVSASSLHGDFEGNPIVTVTSNGHELKIEDVPAINYKDRTLVPIYLLKQLGANITWDNTSYSVDVKMANNTELPKAKTVDTNSNDLTKLKDAYEWLSDTDQALWMFGIQIQQYTNMDHPSDYITTIDLDFQELNKQYEESMAYAIKVYDSTKIDNHINDIIASQSKCIERLTQTIALFKIWTSNKNDSQISTPLKFNFLALHKSAQQNINHTKSFSHKLIQSNT